MLFVFTPTETFLEVGRIPKKILGFAEISVGTWWFIKILLWKMNAEFVRFLERERERERERMADLYFF